MTDVPKASDQPPDQAPDPTDQPPRWQPAHDAACERGEVLYPDPDTGLWVFTRKGLLDRGYCCHSGCRHCPYEKD